MYPVSEASFVAHKATFVERQEIEHWYATVPEIDQKNVRWIRAYGIAVFITRPVTRKNSGWYEAWGSVGTNLIFDPVQCEIHAGPPH
jgi:hypothetical protein